MSHDMNLNNKYTFISMVAMLLVAIMFFCRAEWGMKCPNCNIIWPLNIIWIINILVDSIWPNTVKNDNMLIIHVHTPTNGFNFHIEGLYSLNSWTSYHQISHNPKAASCIHRFSVTRTCPIAGELWQTYHPLSWVRDLMNKRRSYRFVNSVERDTKLLCVVVRLHTSYYSCVNPI